MNSYKKIYKGYYIEVIEVPQNSNYVKARRKLPKCKMKNEVDFVVIRIQNIY